MMMARDRVLKTRWVGVDELAVATYYPDLYPLPRDQSGLRRSFERHGYRPEYPIVVRARRGRVEDGAIGFEIVCGVGRHTVARERGMRRVPIVVLRFDDDNAARAYAIEDNLFNPTSASSRLSLAHRLVLAHMLKECGGACAPRQIWTAAGVSASTYWRADASLGRSLVQILSAHPELQGLDLSRQVAEIIRKDMAPQLTRLFAGEVEVNTFHQAQVRRERPARRAESKPGKSGAGVVQGIAPESVPAMKSNKPDGKTPTAAKETLRKKPARPAKNESNLTLFDLLPT